MSYILDALRRADAERQRGGVPGLHDHTGLPGALGRAPGQVSTAAGRRGLWWAGAAVGLLLALAAAWWLGRGAAQQASGVAPAPAPGPLPGLATAPAVTLPPVAVVQPPQAPAAVPPRPPAQPQPPQVAPVQRPIAAMSPDAPADRQGAPGGRQGTPAGLPAPAAQPAADVATTVAPAASDPVRAWASLPESLRAQLPPLAWSGAVHAERADQRLVVVNGQVAREGDTLAPGVQLLQIRPKSVLLRWQGQRVDMPL